MGITLGLALLTGPHRGKGGVPGKRAIKEQNPLLPFFAVLVVTSVVIGVVFGLPKLISNYERESASGKPDTSLSVTLIQSPGAAETIDVRAPMEQGGSLSSGTEGRRSPIGYFVGCTRAVGRRLAGGVLPE